MCSSHSEPTGPAVRPPARSAHRLQHLRGAEHLGDLAERVAGAQGAQFPFADAEVGEEPAVPEGPGPGLAVRVTGVVGVVVLVLAVRLALLRTVEVEVGEDVVVLGVRPSSSSVSSISPYELRAAAAASET